MKNCTRHGEKIWPWLIFSICIFSWAFDNAVFAMNARYEEKGEDTSARNRLALHIELDKGVYKPQEPISAECKFKNIGKRSLKLKPILFFDVSFHLKMDGEGEGRFIGSHILVRERLRKEDIITILPQGTYRVVRLISNDAYATPNKVGEYELYAAYRNANDEIEGIRVWRGEIKSNIVRFQIDNGSASKK